MKISKFYHLFIKISLIAALVLFVSHSISNPLYATEDSESKLQKYWGYRQRFDEIEVKADITSNGFRIIKEQVFFINLESYGEVFFIPALDKEYNRLAVFLAKRDGTIVYKTDQLETNNRNQGELAQPNKGIAAVSFQDINEDNFTDIIIVTFCENESGPYAGRTYKVGDVLFQNIPSEGEEESSGPILYRDYRLSDNINRYSMNKSAEFIVSYIRDGYSTEFLYTATTLNELLEKGFSISSDQSYWWQFEKWGRLLMVPGTFQMAEYSVFMVYLVNEQGYIVWSFQPMGDYENLYALKGTACKDIDGDGLKDIVVMARYSSEGAGNETIIKTDYSVYYQRTDGFYVGTEEKDSYQCSDSDMMGDLVEKLRAYWGWN